MRFIAAAAIVAFSVLLSVAMSGRGAIHIGAPQISGLTPFSADRTTPIHKQVRPGKPGRADDSCRWAHDNECDDPDIGTGACRLGTDYSDCRALREGENDSCQWARDGECDEPHLGTGACTQGTDRTDCGDIAWMRNQNDSCATSFNNTCEEPGRGRGCQAHTDRADCNGRERPMTITDHFFGRDDRIRVDAQQPPWRFMGQFTNPAGESCTATLIARDVIITAAHCINTDQGVRANGEFQPAAGGASGRAVAYLVSERYDYRRFNSTDEIDNLDWALLRLDRPLGERLGFAGVRNLTGQGAAAATAADLYQAGYSWDTGETLSANVGCHMVEVFADGTFSHQCDTTRGDSGSGLLVRGVRSFELVGVDSSFRRDPKGPVVNIAVSASSFLPYVAEFVAGRTGVPANAGGGKPKRERPR